jgi:hypothetical protein
LGPQADERGEDEDYGQYVLSHLDLHLKFITDLLTRDGRFSSFGTFIVSPSRAEGQGEQEEMDSNRAFGYHMGEAANPPDKSSERWIVMNIKSSLLLALCFGLAVLAAGCKKTEPVPAAAAAEFAWQIDQFADLKILRYQVPGFEALMALGHSVPTM